MVVQTVTDVKVKFLGQLFGDLVHLITTSLSRTCTKKASQFQNTFLILLHLCWKFHNVYGSRSWVCIHVYALAQTLTLYMQLDAKLSHGTLAISKYFPALLSSSFSRSLHRCGDIRVEPEKPHKQHSHLQSEDNCSQAVLRQTQQWCHRPSQRAVYCRSVELLLPTLILHDVAHFPCSPSLKMQHWGSIGWTIFIWICTFLQECLMCLCYYWS